ncbi:MAG TPA: phosphoribosyltransferase family protein [Steroidobacteraceae bacterium]|nr:phosphoribosyltransferase family protein [Steroidobacteraceae bacterium]
MSLHQFANRKAAGLELARALIRAKPAPPLIILGLPRGGVPVAFEVARALHAPLDVLTVRKIGMPGQPELAIGAIASGNIVVHEPSALLHFGSDQATFAALTARERAELERRERLYRHGLPPLELADKTAVLVDDGLATGATMLAAVRSARQAGARSVLAAAPVASREAAALLGREADEMVVLQTPPHLASIGEWYRDFSQVEDEEVRGLLASSHLA